MSFAVIGRGVYELPEVFGECAGCGHYYSLRNDHRVIAHGWDGCEPNIIRPKCKEGGAVRRGFTMLRDLGGQIPEIPA